MRRVRRVTAGFYRSGSSLTPERCFDEKGEVLTDRWRRKQIAVNNGWDAVILVYRGVVELYLQRGCGRIISH